MYDIINHSKVASTATFGYTSGKGEDDVKTFDPVLGTCIVYSLSS